MLYAIARGGGKGAQATFNGFAALADTFPWEEPAKPTVGQFGLLVREPVGVVGAIIPWNAPMSLTCNKLAPALLAGCTVVLKSSPEAPGEGYLMAEAAEAAGLPPGVVNVVTADREVSELLVRDARVDKMARPWPPAAAVPGISTAAGMSSPLSSATSTTTLSSPRRRSSARSCQ